jgi:hypothetical protein
VPTVTRTPSALYAKLARGGTDRTHRARSPPRIQLLNRSSRRDIAHGVDQAEVRGPRPLFGGHVLPLPPVGVWCRRGPGAQLGLRPIRSHACARSRLGRWRRLPAVELPLQNVRGRAHGCTGATSYAIVAGDPWRRGTLVSRERLARPAPAAGDADTSGGRQRPRVADRRRAPDRCGNRPHGRTSAPARGNEARARIRR